jgi:hypothetical protein
MTADVWPKMTGKIIQLFTIPLSHLSSSSLSSIQFTFHPLYLFMLLSSLFNFYALHFRCPCSSIRLSLYSLCLLPSFLTYLFQNSICTLYSHSIPCILAMAENSLSLSCAQGRVRWVFPKHELKWLLSTGVCRCFSYPFVSRYDRISCFLF